MLLNSAAKFVQKVCDSLKACIDIFFMGSLGIGNEFDEN